MKRKPFVLLALCLMLLCTVTLSACKGSEGATKDEADTQVTTTAQSTTVATTTQATEETTAEKATEAVTTEASKETDNGSGNSQQSGGPADKVENTKTATVNVGGKDYTVNVGDKIVYTYYLKTPKAIENVQATLTYDDSVLKLRQSSSKEMFPTLSGTIYNANVTGTVLFNASEPMEGYDFTSKSALVRLEFDVTKEGYASIATAIEFMDEIGGESYVSNFSIVGDITSQETLS